MPPLGQTSDELRLLGWHKAEGEAVDEGELLLEIETDKATLDVEASVSGTLLRVDCREGETVTAVLAAGAAKELGRRFAITRLDVFMSDRRARDERAPFHCPMPPVLPTERIAITPPIISSKEVAQNRPPHFSRQDLLTARNRF